MKEYMEVDTAALREPEVHNSLYKNRSAVAQMQAQDTPEITVLVLAYNRLEKTKRCVESILKYTKGVSYELLLIDNGSSDETLAYYQSISHEPKRLIRVTKNLGPYFPQGLLSPNDFCRYVAAIPNDVIVTEHWLENMLVCIKSDPKIGMVTTVSSNVSNLQEVSLGFRSYEEMQQKAEQFNRSDPRKWEDRLRMITLCSLYRKEVIYLLGWPPGDIGFFHDFADDDASFAIRRVGYRVVLAGDTWVCHDHDFRHGEGKNIDEYNRSLEIGRQNFRDKYLGIDAWEDVNNYLLPYLKGFPTPPRLSKALVLGVDVRCGTPILDIKNWLRQFGILETELS
ncbi:MAG: glycosyltransferase, partial [Deltaproteobacteria bacterium]|nr:glycosyltransferase [Deltaproteobacteria bacterium]